MTKALNVPKKQGPDPLVDAEKYAERLKGKTHKQLMNKILLCDMMLKIVSENEDDPRHDRALEFHTAQRDLVKAEFERRKEAGVKMPDAVVQAETIVLGSQLGQMGQ